MKKYLLLLFSILSLVMTGVEASEYEPDYLILTFPKSGSHLIDKLFHYLNDYSENPYPYIGTVYHLYYENTLRNHHPDLLRYVFRKKKIILIRDPRDIVVSATKWFDKTTVQSYWHKLNIHRKIAALIDETLPFPFSFISHSIEKLQEHLSMAPDCYIVRFEDLIGEKGGGTYERQKDAIEGICEFIGISLDQSELHELQSKLFGLSEKDREVLSKHQTFNKGQIGAWKHYFNTNHKKSFNNKFGRFLLEYGYETDTNW